MVQLKLNVLSQTSYSCMHTHCHTAHFCTEFWLQIKISIAPRFWLKLHSLAIISHTDRQSIPNTQCMAHDKTNHNVLLVQQKCQSFTKKPTNYAIIMFSKIKEFKIFVHLLISSLDAIEIYKINPKNMF